MWGGGGGEVLTGFLFPFYLKSFHINNIWTDLTIMKITKNYVNKLHKSNSRL